MAVSLLSGRGILSMVLTALNSMGTTVAGRAMPTRESCCHPVQVRNFPASRGSVLAALKACVSLSGDIPHVCTLQ